MGLVVQIAAFWTLNPETVVRIPRKGAGSNHMVAFIDWNCVQWTGQYIGGYFGTFSMAPRCGTRHQASGVPTSLPAKNEWTKKFRLLLPLWPNG